MDPQHVVETRPSDERDNIHIKTSDVYNVDKNLPKRFNNPQCFHGYSKKTIHPFYQTSNQTYGNQRPTVHEMPTTFNGSYRKFSEHILQSGMYRDNSFNTAVEKPRITGPDAINTLHARVHFHHAFNQQGPPLTTDTSTLRQLRPPH